MAIRDRGIEACPPLSERPNSVETDCGSAGLRWKLCRVPSRRGRDEISVRWVVPPIRFPEGPSRIPPVSTSTRRLRVRLGRLMEPVVSGPNRSSLVSRHLYR